jgi:hypothetical protein
VSLHLATQGEVLQRIFGVAPLLWRDAFASREEEGRTRSYNNPLTTTSTVALVTPDDTGVEVITGGTHDVLETKARGSRGGSRRKTIQPSWTKKTKTKAKKKTKTGTKSKTKGKKTETKCTAAMKEAGKCKNTVPSKYTAAMKKAGKCPAKTTCTAAEKEMNGSKCPNQKRN